MSGSKFEYSQHRITDIANEIEQEILDSGREKTKEELKWEYCHRDASWYEKYPEDLKHYEYPPEVIEEFKNAVNILKIAHIYAHRIDYLLSGDDGEETFLRRLREDLDKLAKSSI